MPPAQRPAPLPNDKSAASPTQTNPLIGLAVFSADGTKLGNVQSVATNPDGKATAIHLKTGGFLGIGTKLVAIPDGKFTKTGDRVQLSMTSDEVGKLPEYKENL
jgi:sporulation protein YlmC with PRC-barrel domain